MTDSKTIIRTLISSVFSLMVVGCANDDMEEHGELTQLQLIPYGASFTDAEQSAKESTRSIPSGYSIYSTNQDGDIAVYLADPTANTCDYKGNFTYSGSTWTSSVSAQVSTQYYVYGFMPSSIRDKVSISSFGGDYSNGATINLNSIDAISSSDIAIIVGALKGEKNDVDISSSSSTKELKVGQYGYKTSDPGQENYMYLLLDHLYSRINLRLRVDETYDELRTIEITGIELDVQDAPTSVSGTITLEAGKSMTTNMNISSTKGEEEITIFTGTTELTTSYQDISQYCTPGLSSLTFNVKTTYNVYDKDKKESNGYKGNLVRENCQATNSGITITNTTAGKSYNINMTVTPTYLYQLSEPDVTFEMTF